MRVSRRLMKALTELIEDKELDKTERLLVSKLIRDMMVATEAPQTGRVHKPVASITLEQLLGKIE